jgi:hypothetical protein
VSRGRPAEPLLPLITPVHLPGDTREVIRPDARSAPLQADTRRALLLTLLFCCVAVLGTVYHELWRDEWQTWMLARDSTSVRDLLRNMRSEGHPPGWYLILFGLSRFTRSAAAMQAFHVAVATASVYLLARYSPLPWVQKVLIAFGYFFVYEYAVIARSYALSVLALFTFCALFPLRRHRPYALIGSLVLLAVVSAYSLIIAIAASGMLLLERLADSGLRNSWWIRSARSRLVIVVWVATAAAAVLIMRPPDGFSGRTGGGGQPFSKWEIAETTSAIAWAYLPLPDVTAEHPWNTHVVPTGGRLRLGVRLALSSGLIAGAGLLFAHRPLVLFMYATGTFGLLLFQHLFFAGTLRHHGHLFVLFIACLWLCRLPGREWRLPVVLRRFSAGTPAGGAFVNVLLVIQCLAAAFLYAADLRRPFSTSPQVAQLIRDRGLQNLPIAVSPAPAGSSIAGVLDRPVYYVAKRSVGTFIRWGEYARPWDRQLRMELLRPFIDEAQSDVLIILGEPFEAWDDDLRVEELARFEPGLEHREGYIVYRVARES